MTSIIQATIPLLPRRSASCAQLSPKRNPCSNGSLLFRDPWSSGILALRGSLVFRDQNVSSSSSVCCPQLLLQFSLSGPGFSPRHQRRNMAVMYARESEDQFAGAPYSLERWARSLQCGLLIWWLITVCSFVQRVSERVLENNSRKRDIEDSQAAKPIRSDAKQRWTKEQIYLIAKSRHRGRDLQWGEEDRSQHEMMERRQTISNPLLKLKSLTVVMVMGMTRTGESEKTLSNEFKNSLHAG